MSLSKKEVDYMLSQFDSRTRDFISTSPLKYGTNPQIDFLYEDVISLNDSIQQSMDSIQSYVEVTDNLTGEILKATYGI